MDQEQQPRERSFTRELVPDWQPTRDQLVRAIRLSVIVAVALIVVGFLGAVLWIMLGKYIDPQTATERKDIVQSFAIVVAGVVGSLSALAAVGNLYISRRNLQQQRELEEQRAQEEALPAYVDRMVELLNDKDRPLRQSKEGDEVRTQARLRTLRALRRLDPSRKTELMQFLLEADLVHKVAGRQLIIGLSGADLSGANLSGADLRDADLSKANLSKANLTRANLAGTSLGSANLAEASLHEANLGNADLSWADLSSADLRKVNFSGSNLRGATLDRANLSETQLSGAADLMPKFNFADLSSAYLRGADLAEASLRGANLSDAMLDEADLFAAYLKDAKGVSNEQLDQQVKRLDDATMPNGQLYEDWLKSKGRGADGEKSGSS